MSQRRHFVLEIPRNLHESDAATKRASSPYSRRAESQRPRGRQAVPAKFRTGMAATSVRNGSQTQSCTGIAATSVRKSRVTGILRGNLKKTLFAPRELGRKCNEIFFFELHNTLKNTDLAFKKLGRKVLKTIEKKFKKICGLQNYSYLCNPIKRGYCA